MNAINGAQHATFGVVNALAEMVGYGKNYFDPDAEPNPFLDYGGDWSRNKFTREPAWVHETSVLLGGQGIVTLGAMGASAAFGRLNVSGGVAIERYPSGQPQVARAGQAVRNCLGEDLIVKRADTEGFVAISKDGARRFRMDYTGHGAPPHGHVEVLNPKGRWVDAGPEHQYQFKNTGD